MNDATSDSLNRVLRSPLFKNAERQSRFLRHIVEKHLAGDDSSLRETSIGLEVYDRPASYDPKTDPIVRVEASRLRSRLREYYDTEGAEDAIRIDIPKGSYVPTFERRVALPAPVPETVAELAPTAVTRRTPRSWLIPASLGLLALAGMLIAIWLRPPVQAKTIDSIAVFPFSDLSEKKELAYVADGLTDQIQDELARIRDLRVIGSTSAKQASANPDLHAAAKQMGVAALIEGSVRTEHKNVRVTVRLIDGGTGSNMWSGSFDGERTGLFELEERIAQTVAGKLSIQLAVRREGVDALKAPARAQAHEYYQQARAMEAHDSGAPLTEIYHLYQLAANTDPSYAPAHAGLASVIIQSGSQLGGPDGKTRALDEARQAVALDPRLPGAYASLILYYRDAEMNWAKARAACTDSLQKVPNSGTILAICASIEGSVLDRSKQLELMRRAVAMDPLSSRMHGGLMFALYQAGQFDEALSEADVAVRLGSESNFLYRHRALILAAMGKPDEGLTVIDGARSHLGGVPADWMPVRGYLLGQLKRRAEAEQLIREFTSAGALPHQLGLIYLGLGERAKALDYFERAYETDPTDTAHAIPEYYMRVLDGEPRFEAIKRKLGIGQ
jgi:TolB-like protein